MSSLPPLVYFDPRTPPHITTLVILASVGGLALNVFLPSLPAMASHFDASYAVIALSVSLYLGASGVMQLVVGPLSDRFGRRAVVIWSLVLFLVATLGCIYAPTVEIYLFFRTLQAIMVVGVVLSRAIIRDMFPRDQAASQIGYVTMGMAVVPMVGPALGGLLGGIFGWQSSFWMLFILGFAALLVVLRDLGETNLARNASFAAQFRDCPELFRSRRFWGYSLTAMFSAGIYFTYLGGGPRVGAEIFGLSPEWVGMYFSSPAVGYVVGNFLSGRYSVVLGINRMIVIGCTASLAGMILSLSLLVSGVDNPLTFFGPMVFVGLGNGMVLPNATSGMMSVRPRLAGTASGVGGALMTGGGAMLSVLAGVVFSLAPGGWLHGGVMLVLVMVCSSVLANLCIYYTIRREKLVDDAEGARE